jgi:hypothetical protein
MQYIHSFCSVITFSYIIDIIGCIKIITLESRVSSVFFLPVATQRLQCHHNVVQILGFLQVSGICIEKMYIIICYSAYFICCEKCIESVIINIVTWLNWVLKYVLVPVIKDKVIIIKSNNSLDAIKI